MTLVVFDAIQAVGVVPIIQTECDGIRVITGLYVVSDTRCQAT